MYKFITILKMDTVNLLKNPMWSFYSIGLPVLLTYILGFLTATSYGNGITGYDYYGITMIMFAVMNTATLAANSFMENRILKANMRLCIMPIPPYFIYLSKAVATTIFGVVCYTIAAVILRLTVGVNFGEEYTLMLWLLLVVMTFCLSSIGILVCTIFKSEEVSNQVISNIIIVSILIGGVFFPIWGFGNGARMIASWCPVTWVIQTAFELIYDQRLEMFYQSITAGIVVAVVCLVLSHKMFKVEDYV